MTEAQAYNELGWPHKGRGFILPLSGSEETDWRTYHCVECGLEGVTRIDATCPCNTIMLMPRGSIKTTAGAEYKLNRLAEIYIRRQLVDYNIVTESGAELNGEQAIEYAARRAHETGYAVPPLNFSSKPLPVIRAWMEE